MLSPIQHWDAIEEALERVDVLFRNLNLELSQIKKEDLHHFVLPFQRLIIQQRKAILLQIGFDYQSQRIVVPNVLGGSEFRCSIIVVERN